MKSEDGSQKTEVGRLKLEVGRRELGVRSLETKTIVLRYYTITIGTINFSHF
jgi:hypothetical protein